jgi:hypothetical protein
MIQKAKTEPEKETLEAMNRRVEYRILSWDYDPKLKKRKEKLKDTTNTKMIDEDE